MTSPTTTLWIGGTSGLAQTFYHVYPEAFSDMIITGMEQECPDALAGVVKGYFWLNLSDPVSVQDMVGRLKQEQSDLLKVDTLILSIRPPLITHCNHKQTWQYLCKPMLDGLWTLLPHFKSVQRILHISSIAAIHHLHSHVMVSAEATQPNSADLPYPYDRFKRACEEAVDHFSSSVTTLNKVNVHVTHLRLGAIFADNPNCIQCSALTLQTLVGPLLSQKIDTNTCRNVARAMRALLQSNDMEVWKPIIYYTRCTPLPVSYGSYLEAYRTAYDVRYYVNMPEWAVHLFITAFHVMAQYFGRWLPYVESIDYLLQVILQEHTFVNNIAVEFEQESILDGFRQRRRLLRQ